MVTVGSFSIGSSHRLSNFTTVLLAVLSFAGRAGGGIDMPMNFIKTELGEVCAELLEYRCQPIPEEQRTKGQREAIVSARQWLESIATPEFQPPAAAVVSIHSGDASTCDAVRIEYSRAYQFGELAVVVSQTVFVITVTISPRPWPGAWRDNSLEAATLIGRRFFSDPTRISLRLEKQGKGVSIGRQDSAHAPSREARDWLDTLRWWCDGTTVGYVFLKRTGAGQAVLPSLELEPNKVWFKLFERPRTG
jgi:hypothetical protein